MEGLRNQPLEIKLQKPIMYHHKGDVAYAPVVKLLPPTAKNRVSLVKIKQLYFKALNDISAKNTTNRNTGTAQVQDGEEAIDGQSMMMLFYLAETDILALHSAFKELFNHVGELDNEIKLSNYHMDNEISLEDFEMMIGEYFVNFLSPLWTGNLTKK